MDRVRALQPVSASEAYEAYESELPIYVRVPDAGVRGVRSEAIALLNYSSRSPQ